MDFAGMYKGNDDCSKLAKLAPRLYQRIVNHCETEAVGCSPEDHERLVAEAEKKFHRPRKLSAPGPDASNYEVEEHEAKTCGIALMSILITTVISFIFTKVLEHFYKQATK